MGMTKEKLKFSKSVGTRGVLGIKSYHSRNRTSEWRIEKGYHPMQRIKVQIVALSVIVLMGSLPAARGETRTLARCGDGFVEEVDGYRVLHVKGDPYEIGYQQGALLRDDIRELVHFLFDVKAQEMKVELGGLKLLDPKQVIKGIVARQRKYISQRFFDEM